MFQHITSIADYYLPLHEQGKRTGYLRYFLECKNVLHWYLTQGELKPGAAKLARVPPDLTVSYGTAFSLPSQNESHCSVANVCLFEITINIMLSNTLWLYLCNYGLVSNSEVEYCVSPHFVYHCNMLLLRRSESRSNFSKEYFLMTRGQDWYKLKVVLGFL